MNPPSHRVSLKQRLDRRWLALAGAGFVILVVIALLGPALSRDAATGPSTNEPTDTPDPTPTVRPTAEPLTAAPPRSTPTPLPIPAPSQPVNATPDAQVDADEPPTEPVWFATTQTVGATTVAIDRNGIWTRRTASDPWKLTPMQYPTQPRQCMTRINDTLAFTHRPADGTATVSFFAPDLPGWIERQEELPLLAAKPGLLAGFCSGTASADGRLLYVASTAGVLRFAIEQLDGSFLGRSVTWPDDWTHGVEPNSMNARMFRDRGAIAIAHCSYHIDTGCLTTSFQLDSSVIATGGPAEMTWDEAGGAMILPSENSPVTIYADLGGSTSRGFNLIQVRDETWAAELVEELGYNRGPDFTTPVGRWAVGPLGVAPPPMGVGYWPELSIVDDTVVAGLVPLGEPSLDGPWGSSFEDEDADIEQELENQWFRFDDDAAAWVALDEDPTRPGPIPRPEQPNFPPLTWISNDQTNDGSVTPVSPEVLSWDAVVVGQAPLIVGDLAFINHPQALWSSDDRGVSWSEHGALSWRAANPFCGTATALGLAYVTEAWDQPTTLTISAADDNRHIEWPVARRMFLGDRGFSPCRPLRLADQWWMAELGHDMDTLRITATANGRNFTTHSIDLDGRVRELLPGGDVRGLADLYYDEGWMVVRLCRSSEGYVCNQAVDLRLNAELLQTEEPTDPLAYTAAELEMPLPISRTGFLHQLHQVGDQLWSIEINSFENDILGFEGAARVGRYGTPLERVDATVADVRLRNGQVMRCIPDNGYSWEPSPTCETQGADGSWQPVFGNVAVDWATVPAGTPVSFWHRSDDGQILVVPS